MDKKGMDKPSILYVDDDENLRKLMVKFFTSLELRVLAVSSGKEAIERIRQENFDLVFTDFEMPGMNGRELAQKIKEIRPKCFIVLLSGIAVQLDPKIEKAHGIDRVIRKPATLERLRTEIVSFFPLKGRR